ncbi:MAG: element excision factor XisI family protein, partial [Candidatus Poribacteria bacterium]|nr:element excision factor XisI family protein [Candidatus Poribacteria bacterium]
MERIEKYREIIMRVLHEWTEVPPAYGEMIDEIIVDREADRYLWMTRGYQQKHKRIHACIVRID